AEHRPDRVWRSIIKNAVFLRAQVETEAAPLFDVLYAPRFSETTGRKRIPTSVRTMFGGERLEPLLSDLDGLTTILKRFLKSRRDGTIRLAKSSSRGRRIDRHLNVALGGLFDILRRWRVRDSRNALIKVIKAAGVEKRELDRDWVHDRIKVL